MSIQPLKFFQKNGLKMRALQREVLDRVVENWDDKKYFVLSLPTGVGKTFISTAISDAVESSYILTSTIQLQEQYKKSWSGLVEIKGKKNYQCNLNTSFTVDLAPCTASKGLKANCIKNNICAYYNQKAKALVAPSTLTNPAYFLTGIAPDVDSLEPQWKKRKVLIIDEAHNLEEHLISAAEGKITPKELHDNTGVKCKDVKFSMNTMENYKALQQIYEAVKIRYSELVTQLDDESGSFSAEQAKAAWAAGIQKTLNDKITKLRAKIDALSGTYTTLDIFFKSHKTTSEMLDRWLIHPYEGENRVLLTPLYGHFLFDIFLEKTADRFVFLSATIGSKDSFCKELGLTQDKVFFMETDTPFPPEKSPIYSLPLLRMGFKDLPTTLPKIPGVVENILDAHEGQMGIIHSATYNLANEITTKIGFNYKKRLIYRDMNGPNSRLSNQDLIKIHELKKIEGSVLVSPSMMEGVDLKDDLSEFQIILKFPWASLLDPRIKKKADLEPNWYTNMCWIDVLQASGRSTRHEEDESTTYILDASFPYFYKLWMANLPAWFRNRVTISKM